MLATAFTSDAETVHSVPAGSLSRSMPQDTLAQRLVAGPVRKFEAKEHVFRDGDAVTHVFKVEVGHVCIFKLMSDGRRQVIDFAYPGDLIGLGAIGEHATNAQAMSRTLLRCLPIAALHQVLWDDGRLGLKLYEAMSRELLAARELLFTISQRTATERVAAFVVALSRRNERIRPALAQGGASSWRNRCG